MEDFRILDAVLARALVEQVEEPLDGRRQLLVHSQDSTEEVDDKLFNGALKVRKIELDVQLEI